MKKTALITGSSRGIGRAIALALAGPDKNIVINYINNKDKAEETAALCRKKGSRTLVVRTDVSDYEQVLSMFKQIEKEFTLNSSRPAGVDILVNNAGISVYGMLQDISPEDWRRVYGVNVDGNFYCTKSAIPHMVSRKWGRIINISSIWGLVGASCEGLYSSTKGAIIAFTKSCAKELAYSGITVNCIAPGVVDTDMLDQLGSEKLSYVMEDIPIGRLINPDEIADWVTYLADEKSDAISGQTINISGGMIIS